MKKRLMGVALTLVLLWAAACWWGGSELASPPRRALQNYHREFLASPAAHGVSIQPFDAAGGTPCFLVEPLAEGPPGARGQKVREQLLKQPGLELSPPGKVIGTLVLLHGRKGRKEDYLPVAERFCAVGYRCVLADLPAHGDNRSPVAGYGLRENDLPARLLDEAAERFHFAPAPAGLMGMSMGGAVAIQAAAKQPLRWSALAVVSTFDTLENAVHRQAAGHAGSFLGSLWQAGSAQVFRWKTGIALDAIRSVDQVPSLTMPTLVAHGTADSVIPIECGRALFAALPPGLEKQWVEIPGANHDNVLITDFPIYATIAAWMVRHVK